MTNSSLAAKIAELRSALSQSQTLDASTRDALLTLQSDIARALHDESVTERLEELAVRFETEHPAAGTAIREVVNTLVKAGI